jgi:hypothetical protein
MYYTVKVPGYQPPLPMKSHFPAGPLRPVRQKVKQAVLPGTTQCHGDKAAMQISQWLKKQGKGTFSLLFVQQGAVL